MTFDLSGRIETPLTNLGAVGPYVYLPFVIFLKILSLYAYLQLFHVNTPQTEKQTQCRVAQSALKISIKVPKIY